MACGACLDVCITVRHVWMCHAPVTKALCLYMCAGVYRKAHVRKHGIYVDNGLRTTIDTSSAHGFWVERRRAAHSQQGTRRTESHFKTQVCGDACQGAHYLCCTPRSSQC